MRFVLLLLALCTEQVFSQQPSYSVPKIEDLVKLPPSPEAQAFAKYGSIPVNMYTGSPNISIPVASLKGKETEVPITLTYDASGIKVEQIATSVGLGWNLNVGGMIVRETRANPDDFISAFPNYLPFYHQSVKPDYDFVKNLTVTENTNYLPNQLPRYFAFIERALQPFGDKIEIQPDVYKLNALGLSGTFYIDYESGTGVCMEHPDIKATPVFNLLANVKLITGWIVKDASGNTYHFELSEVTHVNENDSYEGVKEYNSAWMLTKVESKNRKDVILFNYSTVSWSELQLAGHADYRIDIAGFGTECGFDEMKSPTYSSPTYSITQQELASISINGHLVAEFINTGRLDLPGKDAISEIKVHDPVSGKIINRLKFNYSYFGNPSGSSVEKRLRLDKLQFYGDLTDQVSQDYKFQYFNEYQGGFPSRVSYSQDFWGYYNALSNTTLIPYHFNFDIVNWEHYTWKGAKRYPKLEPAKVGTLHTMIYPTGGQTEFTYELHKSDAPLDYASNIEPSFELIQSNFLTGGTSASNTYNYCDDRIGTPPYPIGSNVMFTVPTAGNYKVIFKTAGSQQTPDVGIQYGALYASNEPLVFCQLYSPQPIVQPIVDYYNSYVANFMDEKSIYLTSGVYHIFLLNSNPNLQISLEVYGQLTVAETVDVHDVGGLRLKKITDKDINGSVVGEREYQYLYSNLADGPQYEDGMQSDRWIYTNGMNPLPGSCPSTTRYSKNRIQADYHVTYQIVKEIVLNNGYTEFEFYNNPGSYTQGYFKSPSWNGLTKRKTTYREGGGELVNELTYYSERVAGSEAAGFSIDFFNRSNKDVYVRYPLGNANVNYFKYITTGNVLTGGGWIEQHCWDAGMAISLFLDNNYHHCNPHILTHNCDLGNCVNTSHPSVLYYEELKKQNAVDIEIIHSVSSSLVSVTHRDSYNIYCHNFGGEFSKTNYLLPRKWLTLDSTVVTQNGFKSVTKNFYDNPAHYQLTRVETTGSDGVLHRLQNSYAHEMQTTEPSNAIWATLVSANRIAEPIQIESTYGNNQPDFKRKTLYQNVSVGAVTVPLPDRVQISSGTASLEDRVFFNSYDDVGNILEISKANDARVAYMWGYNQNYPIANATNASTNEIFFTSFEFGADLGNSTDGDSRTGVKSTTNGYSKTLTGLTSTKSYMLTYWKKVAGAWTYNTIAVPSGNTFYPISLSGQIDDVRFYPVGALMTTYTYKPLVGITSMSDPNDIVTYYEYDSKGRLSVVRDANGKILKQNLYNYFNPSGN